MGGGSFMGVSYRWAFLAWLGIHTDLVTDRHGYWKTKHMYKQIYKINVSIRLWRKVTHQHCEQIHPVYTPYTLYTRSTHWHHYFHELESIKQEINSFVLRCVTTNLIELRLELRVYCLPLLAEMISAHLD